jgi:large subunit ribosomal protein L19
MNKIIEEFEKEQILSDRPKFGVGDKIKVFSKIIEGKKERIQFFEGVVIAMKNGGISRSFTVRKIVGGTGVEKTFLLNSPKITEITILREGKVRRAKLYYLRDRVGAKANRIKAKDPRYN